MKKSLIIIIGVVLTLLILIGSCISYLFFIPNFENKESGKQYLYLKDGANINDVLTQLQSKTHISNMFTFSKTVQLLKYKDNVKPGRYLIPNGGNNFSFLRRLHNGIQTPVELTFNNIRTKEQLSGVLSKQLMADSVKFINLLNDSTFLAKYNLNKYDAISVFLPNTYQIFWNIKPEKLFERMYQEYCTFWTPARKQKASEIPFTQSEVITLASIVDGESNSNTEKPIIAGLYINRLKKNMPLQADPTIVFAVGDFSIKRVLNAYTHIDSPYNTYRNTGLPPGPIRIPNLKTIDAVLNYDKNDYIYMCAKETLNGEHNFANNWTQHQDNAKKYRQALNERGIH